jgi:hypothetical protein
VGYVWLLEPASFLFAERQLLGRQRPGSCSSSEAISESLVVRHRP